MSKQNKFIANMKLLGYKKSDFNNFSYCGADVNKSTQNYWKLIYKDKPLPSKKQQCICEKNMTNNYYIRNDKEVILIICHYCLKTHIKHNKRTCNICKHKHNNKTVNLCNNCKANQYNNNSIQNSYANTYINNYNGIKLNHTPIVTINKIIKNNIIKNFFDINEDTASEETQMCDLCQNHQLFIIHNSIVCDICVEDIKLKANKCKNCDKLRKLNKQNRCLLECSKSCLFCNNNSHINNLCELHYIESMTKQCTLCQCEYINNHDSNICITCEANKLKYKSCLKCGMNFLDANNINYCNKCKH
jgi:hypothetical protein